MNYFVNDVTRQLTIIKGLTHAEGLIYAAWASENSISSVIKAETVCYEQISDGELILSYYGFSIDTLIDAIFELVPARSQSVNNVKLFKLLLKNPELPKLQCCVLSNKQATHYNRLGRAVGHYCQRVAALSGGRNPMKLLRAIRGDI
ncbi:hypothetical protein [Serratia proteamaculans]|uniref:hypothetical protein n=1 Tax=Serratia proteamaculans TaxID=28151 RepID=UPI003D074C96